MIHHSAVFLDLQGTLGGDGLGDIRDFTYFPCAIPAIRLLNQLDLLTIVVTTQSNIAKGLLTYPHYEERVNGLKLELKASDVRVDSFYCCPHGSPGDCPCQKPRVGLRHDAQHAFDIDLKASYVIGDWGSVDIVMARAADCKGILVRTGVGENSLNEFRHTWSEVEPDFIAADILQAAEWIAQDRGYGDGVI